jgi:hypothetical protein
VAENAWPSHWDRDPKVCHAKARDPLVFATRETLTSTWQAREHLSRLNHLSCLNLNWMPNSSDNSEISMACLVLIHLHRLHRSRFNASLNRWHHVTTDWIKGCSMESLMASMPWKRHKFSGKTIEGKSTIYIYTPAASPFSISIKLPALILPRTIRKYKCEGVERHQDWCLGIPSVSGR